MVRSFSQSFGKAKSLSLVLVAYICALAVGAYFARMSGASHPLFGVATGYLSSAITIYIWSLALDNGSMFDAWWSVLPAGATLWLLHLPNANADLGRSILVTIAVLLWSIRLTSNWARDWPGLHHEDWRYVDLYKQGPKPLISLGAIHIFPAFMVFLVSMPLVPTLCQNSHNVPWINWLAFILCALGTTIEFVADEQMRRFSRTKQSGDVMTTGLWKYSRHPNYFGELLFWWSLWLFVLSSRPSWWWTVIGPVALTAMFLGASIPMLDERSRKRRPAFSDYAARTSRLIPLPPKKG